MRKDCAVAAVAVVVVKDQRGIYAVTGGNLI